MGALSSLHSRIAAIALVVVSTLSQGAGPTASADAGVSVISPAFVDAAAITQVLFSTSTGAFTLSIPGASGGSAGDGTGTQGGAPVGGLALTSTDGSPPSGEQLAALTVTDGTLNGGQGVSFSFQGDGSTQLVGTVAFN